MLSAQIEPVRRPFTSTALPFSSATSSARSRSRAFRTVVDDPPDRVREAPHARIAERLHDALRHSRRGVRWPPCTLACTQSSSASTSSGRSSFPSGRMSHSMPRRTRNGASRSLLPRSPRPGGDVVRVEPGDRATCACGRRSRGTRSRDRAPPRHLEHLAFRPTTSCGSEIAAHVASSTSVGGDPRTAARVARVDRTACRGRRTHRSRGHRRGATRATRRIRPRPLRAGARCRNARGGGDHLDRDSVDRDSDRSVPLPARPPPRSREAAANRSSARAGFSAPTTTASGAVRPSSDARRPRTRRPTRLPRAPRSCVRS